MPQFIEKKCIECGKKFMGDIRPHNKRCSRECLYKSKSYRKLRSKIAKKLNYNGNRNPNWKGGKYLSSYGYVYIYSPKHPFKNNIGYVFKHRLVMEKFLGRYLKKKEVVHHKNGNKSDNRLKNLQLFKNHGKHIAMENHNRTGMKYKKH
jgi:hypothetical protein